MIEAHAITRRFGSFVAVDDVNFRVERGEVAGFLGLNGAGKTTTLRMVACYLPPSRGVLRVAGLDTVRESDAVRRRIGYLPERVPLYDDLRVTEYLHFRARLKGLRGGAVKAAVDRVIDRVSLGPKRRATIGTLSKGLRQRVGIADALVHDPELLILDEPTSGLDPDQRIEVRRFISELRGERTVFLSTHILPEAEAVCDRVIIIHEGRIRASDRLEDLRKRDDSVLVVHTGGPLEAAGLPLGGFREASGTTEVLCPAREVASRVVREAVLAGREVLEMNRRQPNLEAVFLQVTGATGGGR